MEIDYNLAALSLVNSFYQPLGPLKCMTSNSELWAYSIKRATEVISLIESTGALRDRECGFLRVEKNHKEYWVNLRKALETL